MAEKSDIHADIQGLGIVFLGDFSPKIFQPAWFASQGLIRQQEAEAATIKIIHSEVTEFTLDWCRLFVTQERFQLSTLQEPYYEPLRDLALGTFKMLQHTPIKMMGINLEKHFRVESEELWHRYGDRLAPKEPWADILDGPGLRTLIMEESSRRDGRRGYTRVTVQPSEQVQPGLFYLVNDHYEVNEPTLVVGSNQMMTIVEQCWKQSISRSSEIIARLLERK
jgi:hypothetical protein